MRQRRWIELLSDYECEIKYHPGKANVVADALSRKERLKPRRVCAMSITIHSGLKTKILEAHRAKASKDLKSPSEIGKLDHGLKIIPSRYSVHPGADKMYYDLETCMVASWTDQSAQLPTIREGTIKTREARQGLCQRDCSRDMESPESYADKRLKPLEFKVGDRVLLKVSPWKRVVQFGNERKVAPVPIKIVERDMKKLKQRRISLVKVRWNSRKGAEYTWEHEDQFRKKYPHLFSETVPPSGVAT
ncbi:hypothetical protein Tco_0337275 [Tanacetum coccineum]